MFKVHGWWLPDGEEHLVGMLAEHIGHRRRGNYQRKKYIRAMQYNKGKNRRRAIDIGAHVGLWSLDMTRDFEHVESFEPVAAHRDCFVKNVNGANLYPYACGEEPGRVSMQSAETSSGDTTVVPGDDVEMVVLDDYDFKDVDFVKIDCEGYELFVLRGMEKTLLREKPTIIVEQKPGHAQRFGLKETEACDYLKGLGFRFKAESGGDYIFIW